MRVLVPHDVDGFNGEEVDGAELLDVDGVGELEALDVFGGDGPEHTDHEAGAEKVAMLGDERGSDGEQPTQRTDLV